MSDWKECKLGDVAILNYGKGLPEHKRIQGDIPVFSSAGITGWHNEALINNKGVIVGRKGTIGTVYYSEKPFFCIDTAYYIEPKEEKYNLKYLFYLLGTLNLKELNEDSAVPGLNRDTAYSQELLLPPLPEQRAIAGVLSILDEKIELLHQQNKTLEGMAETLWRKMFVEDADPSWKKGKLGDLIELCYGKGLKGENRITGKYPVVGSSGIVGYHNDYLVKGPGIVIGRKGTLGVVNYIDEDFFPIDTTYFIKSKTNSGRLFFEYFLLKEFAFEDMNSDSAVPGLNRQIAESMELSVPEIENILEFNGLCEPLLLKKIKNNRQIHTLSRFRDTLLSKLMSGEVRIKS